MRFNEVGIADLDIARHNRQIFNNKEHEMPL